MLTSEVIDRGENFEFLKSTKKISKNDVSSVQENSKNAANAITEREIELLIFLSTIFPEVVGTYLHREVYSHAPIGSYRLLRSLRLVE